MSGATAAALAARLDSSAASFLAIKKSLYDFAAVEGDPEPVALVRAPAKDAGADIFWRASHRPAPALSLPMKDVREMWAHSRQRVAVSSVQDWGLATLQSAVEHAQSLPTDDSAAEQLEAQLASIQQQISFFGRTWLDGMSSDSFLSTRLHGALRESALAEMPALPDSQKERLRALPLKGDSLFNGELRGRDLLEETSQRLRDLSEAFSLLRGSGDEGVSGFRFPRPDRHIDRESVAHSLPPRLSLDKLACRAFEADSSRTLL